MNNEVPTIYFKRLTGTSLLPSRGSIEAAGLDLQTLDDVTLAPGDYKKVRTGIAVELPVGTVGLIWPRSKLAANYGIDVLAGVIDSDYRGELVVLLINHGSKTLNLKHGDKIAQMIVQPQVSYFPMVETDELAESDRADKGINCTELRL